MRSSLFIRMDNIHIYRPKTLSLYYLIFIPKFIHNPTWPLLSLTYQLTLLNCHSNRNKNLILCQSVSPNSLLITKLNSTSNSSIYSLFMKHSKQKDIHWLLNHGKSMIKIYYLLKPTNLQISYINITSKLTISKKKSNNKINKSTKITLSSTN